MIKDDLNKFPKAMWIHFYKDCMKLMEKDDTVKAIETPQMPYHYPRMVLADFERASSTLKALMKHHSQGFSFFKDHNCYCHCSNYGAHTTWSGKH